VALLAALWLLGLWFAAPSLRSSDRYDIADRLRDAAILGVAIPGVLALAGAFYAPCCWALLAIALVIAYKRRGWIAPATPIPWLTIATLVLVAWPQLMRPLLDGDSLSYHLPIAASWVQAHSLWTTGVRYWYYPPASEAFAAGLYATGGPLCVGWAGFAAAALLVARIVTWARQRGASPLLADALGAATIAVLPLALQSGTLQNDLWLAAFALETLAAAGRDDGACARSAALCALVKPYGWIFSGVALLCARARLPVWIAAACAFGAWGAHDLMLAAHAFLPIASSAGGGTWATTIAGHGFAALLLLAQIALTRAPFALVALLCALAAPLIEARDRRIAWFACFAVVFFAVMPFGFANDLPQLATGVSIRYAAPAIALGALVFCGWTTRYEWPAIVFLVACSTYGIVEIGSIFSSDLVTRTAWIVAAAALIACGLAALSGIRLLPQGAAAIAIAAAVWLAARQPVAYYTDALRVDGQSNGIYAWIARVKPAAIGGSGLWIGAVNVLSPATRTVDLPDDRTCNAARAAGVLFVAVAESGYPQRTAARMAQARRCGRIFYENPLAVVARGGE
jgi:hypothetical protein